MQWLKSLIKCNIDPIKHVMSTISFGEYMPVQRSYPDPNYNADRLERDNNTPEKQDRN